MARINLNTATRVVPKIYAYTTPEIKRHDGWTKIGYTEQETEARLGQQTHTADVLYKLEWDLNAIFEGTGEVFHDSDFHAYLTKNGIERSPKTEWFKILPIPSKHMFYAFRENRGVVASDKATDYSLRPEQEKAVNMALDYFKKHENGQFLFNAKPRFGKTLTTYELCKRLKAKNILIVTNRPAIANSWYDDYAKFLTPESGYMFVSAVDTLQNKKHVLSRDGYTRLKKIVSSEKFIGCIEFVSLQDLKGSLYFGGKYDKLKYISTEKWDLLVIDEAHEGVDTYKTDVAFDHINAKNILHLSGTPFKALANDKFSQDAIFNWTYADEQEAKRNFNGNLGTENPYAKLPQLNMYTYQISQMIEDKLSIGININDENEDYYFGLNDFFATNKLGAFIHSQEVDKFLDSLTQQEKFPFSTDELRKELKHTLWLLNRVDSAKALAKKLQHHPVFKNYEIVLAAGDGRIDLEEDSEVDDREIKKAFDKVTKAIKEHDKTITISVGQLTTGVTIPEWTAVLMLSDIKSPALYMQAAFRAQNPCLFHDKNGYYRKKNAYIFDFDPARTLITYEQIANGLSEDTSGDKGDSDTRKQHVRQLLNFFPVLGEDDNGEMVQLDAEKVLSIPRKLKSQEVVRHGFMSNFLFQNIGHVFSAPQSIIDLLSKIEAVQEPKTAIGLDPNTSEELSLDEDGEVNLSSEFVIGTASSLFGDKLFADLDIDEEMDDVIQNYSLLEDTKKKGEDLLVESLANTFNINIADKVLEKASEEYGKGLSASSKKALERKIKSKAEIVIRKAVDEHKIQNRIIEKEKEDKISQASTREEIDRIDAEYEKKKKEAKTAFEENLSSCASTFIKDAGETIVTTVETEKREQKKKTIEDGIKDHLRGFSRTIPSFLMAYGNANTELSNFEKGIPDDVFIDVTSISKKDFILLRDGGDVFNNETGEWENFHGKLFDEVVFNDSVKEFLRKKQELANYFEESHKEDIFDYIPPQKTNQIFTPKAVVQNMVDMLEKENPDCFNDPTKTFADLYMKSGMYLSEIVKRLYRSEKIKQLYPNGKERLVHIFAKQVYGCAPTEILYRICLSYLLGFADTFKIEEHNIKLCDTLKFAKEGTLEKELEKLFNL